MSAPAGDVDEYLAALPEEQRTALEKVRRAIKAAAPKAQEIISYQIPTYKHHGMLLSFGTAKNHCALYGVSESFMNAHKDELMPYDTAKATIRFPASKPPPYALVKRLVKVRVAENEAAAASKKQREKKHGRKTP